MPGASLRGTPALRGGLFMLVLTAVVFAVYQPAWHGGLLWDDDMHVPRPELRSWDGLRRVWCELKTTSQYYPVVHSVFWLEHRLWGGNTLGYHLVNVALHVLAALLVLRILKRLKIPGAYLATAIFALHPVQVESVAWITELKNTLSGVFYLGALLSYLRFDRSRSKTAYGIALLLFALALLSKTVTATLPGAVLLILWWQRGRLDWKRDVLPLLPFFMMALAGGLLSAWMERKVAGAEGVEYALTWVERLLLAGRAAWFYVGKLFWPENLAFIYPRWQISQGAWWQYLFPLTAAGLLAGLWRIRGLSRAPLAAALYFGGTLFPALGFLNVYPFRYSYVADHFQYLACLGLIVLTAAALAQLPRGRPVWLRPAGQSACVAGLAALAILSWRQSRMYADIQTLYRTTIARNPDCWMAYGNLGLVEVNSGRAAEAIELYRQALRVKPDYADAESNLGNALGGLGRLDEAIEHYRRALRIEPDHIEAHSNLGTALVKAGRIPEAIEQYRQALRIKPNYADAHSNLGTALAGLGRFSEAIEQYRDAVRIDPQFAEAHYSWGLALAALGRYSDAVDEYQQAVRIKPGFPEAEDNWGIALFTLHRLPEAIAHYRQAVRIKPDYIQGHNNLGNALVEWGCFAEAVEHYQQALHIKPDFAEAQLNLALALLRTGKMREAIEHGRHAARLMPNQAAILRFVAWLMATHEPADGGDPAQAVQWAEHACAQTGRRDVACLDTLAAAYAAAGRFDEAVTTAKEARRLAEAAGQQTLADEIQMRLNLYRDRKPYREPLHAHHG
jgi:tetratricopeptide (TPR) repeat protein